MLFDRFDSIRIVNLAHRTDRRAEMLGELRRVGLEGDPRLSFFDAVAPAEAGTFSSKGARGCYLSHLAILQEAAAAGRSVLILEDDLDFAPGARDYRLPADVPIFYGSYTATNPADFLASDIIGSPFMGFGRDIVPPLVDYLTTILASGHHPPIDGAYVWFRRAHPDVRTVFAQPPLGHQRPSRTDIAEPKLFDTLPGLKQAASIARKLKRAVLR